MPLTVLLRILHSFSGMQRMAFASNLQIFTEACEQAQLQSRCL